MPNNFILLERITVGAAGATSVTFSNIPQTGYTDLKIVMSARLDVGNFQYYGQLNFNNDTGNNYSSKRIYGAGSSTGSDNGPTNYIGSLSFPAATATASTFGNLEIYIPNYTSANPKSVSIDQTNENNSATQNGLELRAGLWSSTSAITSAKITPSSGNFVQYSTFSLYALAAVGTTPTVDPKALGGDIIQTDGTYWYHAFLSSGTFTPKTPISCDVLVVAGGGGGGKWTGGGGGAGGVLGYASQYLTASANTVQVGAGGAGGSSPTVGVSGVNSQFASLTASVGGGGGGGYDGTYHSPTSGGSGGGGTSTTAAEGTGASGTSSQGYAGGNGIGASYYNGAGGGGAGGIGGNASSVTGNGGAAINTYTNATWLSSALSVTGLGVSGYIAGGGSGGGNATNSIGTVTGGAGLGANSSNAGANAVSNTGSGGGGSGGVSPSASGGNGGSGLVIVRYLV